MNALRRWVRSLSLRWHLIGAQMTVVLVGVITLVLALEWALRTLDPATLETALASLPLGDTLPAQRLEALLALVRRTSVQALIVAAVAATITGLATSVLLTRQLLRSLQGLSKSAQRIARGHYEERVTEPPSAELATVATSFNQMAEALEQVEQQRAQLIGNVMHELRTPLSALGGYLQGMMDGVFQATPQTFGQMDREVRRLRRLVSDLQELSAVEVGQISLHLATFDLQEVVRLVVHQLHPQASAGGVALAVPEEGPPLFVHADPDRVTQVLMNLVGNAIRYTPDGGHVALALHQRERAAEVAVIDDGVGIPPEALPYLFERFYRVDPSRDRRTGGSGIGLTISRHLAWAMGGDLSAESGGTGQGSTFRFTLPLATVA